MFQVLRILQESVELIGQHFLKKVKKLPKVVYEINTRIIFIVFV